VGKKKCGREGGADVGEKYRKVKNGGQNGGKEGEGIRPCHVIGLASEGGKVRDRKGEGKRGGVGQEREVVGWKTK